MIKERLSLPFILNTYTHVHVQTYIHNHDYYTYIDPVLQYGNDSIMTTSSYACTYDYNMFSFKQEVLTKTNQLTYTYTF